jgi:hypothetical protein
MENAKVKNEAKRLVEELPEDATWVVRQAVEAGLRDSDAGRAVSVEEVRVRFGLSGPDSELAAWQEVYAGLSEDEIAEIESLALDRSRFSRKDDD